MDKKQVGEQYVEYYISLLSREETALIAHSPKN